MFAKEHLDKSLFQEIVKRNFNKYDVKDYDIKSKDLNSLLKEDLRFELNDENAKFLKIHRSLYVASIVGLIEEKAGGKAIFIHQLKPKGFFVTKVIPIIFLFSGCIPILIAYFIHKHYQKKLMSEIIEVFEKCLNNPEIVNYIDEVLMVLV
jgi:hypothetical protein